MRFAITSVNNGSNPTAGVGFPVVVQAQLPNGTPVNVTAATGVSLSLKTGTGTLGGTLNSTIVAGTNQTTMTGVTYTKAESGVVITATRTSGENLTAGDSAPFTVNPGAATIPLIVKLNVPLTPLGYLTPAERIAQRDAIIAAQDQLLAELTGTQYTVIHRYNNVDAFALDVGPDALSVLANSSLVTNIKDDIPGSPLLSDSAPLIGANQAWSAGFDGTGSVVSILNTGVDGNHPFLTGSVIAEACFSKNGNCPSNSAVMVGPGAGVPCTYAVAGCRHGTHVAGIVAGRGAAFSGVAKGAIPGKVQRIICEWDKYLLALVRYIHLNAYWPNWPRGQNCIVTVAITAT